MTEAELIVKYKNGNEKVFHLDAGETSIGRRGCTINIGDVKVSRAHVKIACSCGRWEIEDQGSSNGTFLNGRKIKRAPLRDKDKIKIGATQLIFKSGETKPCISYPMTETFKLASWEKEFIFEEDSESYGKAEEQRAKADLAAMYKAGQILNSTLDSQELLAKALDLILSVIKSVDCCSIHLYDDENKKFNRAEYCFRDKQKNSEEYHYSKSLLDAVLKSGDSVLVYDANNDTRFNKAESVIGLKVRSAMCVPVRSHARLVAAIQACTLADDRKLAKEDLKLVTAIAILMGMAFENATLYERLSAEKNMLQDVNRKLEIMKDNLVQSEKLAAIGQLTAGIVHDVKNPLSVIYGHSMIMRDHLEEGARKKGEEFVKKIMTSADAIQSGVSHCLEIINQLLHFSRQAPPEKKMVDVNDIIRSVLDFLRHEFTNKSISIKLGLSPSLPGVFADENQLKQAFMNIMLNAVQAVDKTPAEIQITSRRDGDFNFRQIVVGVKDNGVGMEDDLKKKIFDPFFTTKLPNGSDPGGTGLGLSVTYGLIQNHFGRIEVESEAGKGSEFLIYLPVKEGSHDDFQSSDTSIDIRTDEFF